MRLDYEAFGGVSGTGAEVIPQGFAGGLYDAATGLVRFGVRDYDPRVGRWTVKDPIRWGGGQANLYVYAGNEPVNRRDPTGLTVYLCNRIGELTGDQARDIANGYRHWWIWNSELGSEAGMGPDPSGWDGIFGGLFSSTMITDHPNHHSEQSWKDVQCNPHPDVDEVCADSIISNEGESLGPWIPKFNDCGSFAFGVLAACSNSQTLQCTFDGSDACGSW